jgi:hypothetical protein
MSLAESHLMFLIGAIGSLLFVIILEVSSRRYRRELIEAGGAQTTLGTIGCAYLEGEARVLVAILAVILGSLMSIGNQGLLSQYLGPSSEEIILFVLVSVCLFLLAWFFLGPGDGKARRVVWRVMRSYWSHRNVHILRPELVALSEGDETQRRALELIAKRGCKASLVAREVIAGAA